MKAFESTGYSMEEYKTLNVVRLHQQVCFESDIFDADGRTINAKYLYPRKRGEKWSKYKFSRQQPPHNAFALWREAISHLAPGGRCNPKLGSFLHPPQTLWQCRYDPSEDVVILLQKDGQELYRRQGISRRARTTPYTREGMTSTDTSTLPLCSTRLHLDNKLTVLSHTPPPPPSSSYQHFHDLLLSWTNRHWWEDLKYTGDGTWLYYTIKNGTLTCVSDGSYIRELHPQVCSAAIEVEGNVK
jgi:hypothetical protein